jgi:hypothetical protein
MSYLRYLCLFTHSGVQHLLCCVFVLFFFVLLPVFLDFPFLIACWVCSSNCIVDRSMRMYVPSSSFFIE